MPGTIKRKQWGDVNILEFIGEFGMMNVPTLGTRIDNLIEQGQSRIVFNLRLVTFMNSTWFGYVDGKIHHVRDLGGDLVLSRPSRFVRRVLNTLGLDEKVKCFETDEEAVLYFTKGEAVEPIDLSAEGVELDEELFGVSTLMFRPLDDDGAELLGPKPLVGKIADLQDEGLVFHWTVPPASSGLALNRDNFPELMQPGRRLKVKFRQHLAVRTRYFEAECEVLKAEVRVADDEAQAEVVIRYTRLDPEDKAIIDRYRGDIEALRKRVR